MRKTKREPEPERAPTAKTTRIKTLLAGPDFKPLLEKLKKHVVNERKRGRDTTKRFDREDYRLLESTVRQTAWMYETSNYLINDASTFHELRDSEIAKDPRKRGRLDYVITLLEDPANYDATIHALGAYGLPMDGDQIAVEQAKAWLASILRGLDAIKRAVPPLPEKRRPGPPSKRKDLDFFVSRLAAFWERVTGHAFKIDWSKNDFGKPGINPGVTNAARFVYDVVNFVDPTRRRSLRKATEEVVKNRRPATTPRDIK